MLLWSSVQSAKNSAMAHDVSPVMALNPKTCTAKEKRAARIRNTTSAKHRYKQHPEQEFLKATREWTTHNDRKSFHPQTDDPWTGAQSLLSEPPCSEEVRQKPRTDAIATLQQMWIVGNDLMRLLRWEADVKVIAPKLTHTTRQDSEIINIILKSNVNCSHAVSVGISSW